VCGVKIKKNQMLPLVAVHKPNSSI